jgi:hypothetical protein
MPGFHPVVAVGDQLGDEYLLRFGELLEKRV